LTLLSSTLLHYNPFHSGLTEPSRPSGHLVGPNGPSNACFYNNAAIAARYALTKYRVNKVAVLDFDEDHGIGTEEGFYKFMNGRNAWDDRYFYGSGCCIDHIHCSDCKDGNVITYGAKFTFGVNKYLCEKCASDGVISICQRDNNHQLQRFNHYFSFPNIMKRRNWTRFRRGVDMDDLSECHSVADPSSKHLKLCEGCFWEACGDKECRSRRIENSNFCKYHTYKCSNRDDCENERTTNRNDEDKDSCKACQICRFPVLLNEKKIALCAEYKDNCINNKNHICIYIYKDSTRCNKDKTRYNGTDRHPSKPGLGFDHCEDHQFCHEKNCADFCLRNSSYCSKHHTTITNKNILVSISGVLHFRGVILAVLTFILLRIFGDHIGCCLYAYIYNPIYTIIFNSQDEDDGTGYDKCLIHSNGFFFRMTCWVLLAVLLVLFRMLWVDYKNKVAKKGIEQANANAETDLKKAVEKDESDKREAEEELKAINAVFYAREKDEADRRKEEVESERKKAFEARLDEEESMDEEESIGDADATTA